VVEGSLLRGGALPHLPVAIFFQTLMGSYAEAIDAHDPADEDMLLRPDWSTYCDLPWKGEGFAQVICEAVSKDGSLSPFDPRNVLRRVVEAYAEDGLTPIVAPEIEFYLVAPSNDPVQPLQPAAGQHGQRETGSEAYAIDALVNFEELLDEIRQTCEALGVPLTAIVHEMGPAQIELNMRHAGAVEKADDLFLAKRIVKAYAYRAGYLATFMAKPMENRHGSGLHVHQSVLRDDGSNLFALPDGKANAALQSHIAGLQTYLPKAMALISPSVNSYKRLVKHQSAPVNCEWGYDNRTVGFRVPFDTSENARVENRVPGADSNPYLILAASLACGLIGLRKKLKPTEPHGSDAFDKPRGFPLELDAAVAELEGCPELVELLGKEFVEVYCSVKRTELAAYRRQVTPWEREYLARDI